jgi:DNA-binding transcriptional MerR regulator
MSSRTYLSIGDVLALLRQEFPDVTISKIRFLESQGLVNPERTPSGYRKFYEHDVERLRWVLRQQREHFLPLKVIKGRLEQEVEEFGDENGHDASSAPGHDQRVLVGQVGAPTGPRATGRELPGFEAQSNETARRGTEPGRGRPAPTRTRTDTASSAAATTATALGSSSRTGTSPAPAPGTAGRASAATTSAGRGAPVGDTASRPVVSSPGTGPGSGDARLPGGARTATGVSDGPVKVSGGAAMRSSDVGHGHDAAGHSAAVVPEDELADELVVGALSGASMTVEELAQGSGLDVAAVEQLESYGLLCGRLVGGVSYYDEDALTVARVAAGLARYGVEARHLRLHKHAAEREAGFIEQIVVPLLKQRNPEARQRAHEIVTELTQLGQALREVLLRTTLRDQLGR